MRIRDTYILWAFTTVAALSGCKDNLFQESSQLRGQAQTSAVTDGEPAAEVKCNNT